MRALLDKLRKEPLVRSLIVLGLGLIMLNFLFSLLFGTQNIMYQFMGFINLVIQILVLVLLVAFFYGLYLLIKENADPYIKPVIDEIEGFLKQNNFIKNSSNSRCSNCQKVLQSNWKCCPFCGSDVNSEDL